MGNHLKFCGCRACRDGRHTARNQKIIVRASRRFRRSAKVVLRKGGDPDRVATVPYTD